MPEVSLEETPGVQTNKTSSFLRQVRQKEHQTHTAIEEVSIEGNHSESKGKSLQKLHTHSSIEMITFFPV